MDGDSLVDIFQEIIGLMFILLCAGAIAGCLLVAGKIPEAVRYSNENKSTVQRDFYGTNETGTNDRNGMEQYDGIITAEEVEQEGRSYLAGGTVSVYVNGNKLNGRAVGNNVPLETYLTEYDKNGLFSLHILSYNKNYARTYGTDAQGNVAYVLYDIQ